MGLFRCPFRRHIENSILDKVFLHQNTHNTYILSSPLLRGESWLSLKFSAINDWCLNVQYAVHAINSLCYFAVILRITQYEIENSLKKPKFINFHLPSSLSWVGPDCLIHCLCHSISSHRRMIVLSGNTVFKF